MQYDELAQLFVVPSRGPLSKEVVVRLREAILSGQLAPGEELREQDLAQSLGVSRGPVREALKLLEREGLVIKEHNKRAFVARLSREDLNEVYSLRHTLEALAVQYACRDATPADLKEMASLVDAMAVSVKRGVSAQEIADLDTRFHDALYCASHHRHLYAAWENLRPQVHILLLSRNAADADFRNTMASGHKEILDAIRDHDEKRALAAIESHLRYAYDRVARSYSHPESGVSHSGNVTTPNPGEAPR